MLSRIEATLIDCPLCGAPPDRHEVVSKTDRRGRALRSVLCPDCGLVFSNPMPAADTLDSFYATDYRREYHRTLAPKPRHILRSFRLARQRLDMLRPYLPAGGRILDLGSGGGEWVHALARAGYLAEGVEPNIGYAEYAIAEYGHPITVAPLDSAALPDGRFDVVTAFQVLEHLRDPGSAIDHAHRLLAPKGRLIVEVPDIAARYQSNASKFHPAHVIGFTNATLSALARRRGFSIDADLTGRLSGEDVALVLARASAGVPGAMPPAKGIARTRAALARGRYLHRRTVPNLLRKVWSRITGSLATRGMTGRRIADKVLGG